MHVLFVERKLELNMTKQHNFCYFFAKSKNGIIIEILETIYGIKCQQIEQICMANLGRIG